MATALEILEEDYDYSEEEGIDSVGRIFTSPLFIRKGYASQLRLKNIWKLWMQKGTTDYTGPILWIDLEVDLKWGVLKWLLEKDRILSKCASLAGKILGVFEGRQYLGVGIYKHTELDNLYWFAFAFEPGEGSASTAGPPPSLRGYRTGYRAGLGALPAIPLVAIAVGIIGLAGIVFGIGYVIRSIRMRKEDISKPPDPKKPGLGDTLKQIQDIILYGTGAFLLIKLMGSMGSKKE